MQHSSVIGSIMWEEEVEPRPILNSRVWTLPLGKPFGIRIKRTVFSDWVVEFELEYLGPQTGVLDRFNQPYSDLHFRKKILNI